MTDGVHRAAARAAVAASHKTGRPVNAAVAALAATCRDPQHDCSEDCPQCGVGALRERIAHAAVSVMVGSPYIVKAKVSEIAWDVAGSVVDELDAASGVTARRKP